MDLDSSKLALLDSQDNRLRKSIHILITSAGRRTSLVKLFQKVDMPLDIKLFVSDIDGLAPSLFLQTTNVALPPVSNENYQSMFATAIERFNIDLVIPTIDTELELFAKLKNEHQSSTNVLVSELAFCELCADKWLTHQFCLEHQIMSPNSWLPDSSDIPDSLDSFFIKPRRGSASVDSYEVKRENLNVALSRVNNPIIQELIDGEEISVDVLFDLEGKLLHYVPRLRIRTLAGESIQGVTVDDKPFLPWLVEVLELLGRKGARGPITLQFFDTGNEPVLTDINPRFGGGFPLSHAAGGKYPEWIIDLLIGNEPATELGNYTKNLYMTRSFKEVFTLNPKW